MANQNAFLCSIYQINNNAYGTATGRLMSFPSTGIVVRGVDVDSNFTGVVNGVTMNAAIQLLPSGGLVINQPLYYTPKTVTEVNTLQNT